MGSGSQERDPNQIVHRFGKRTETIDQLVPHIVRLRLRIERCNPFINLQLLFLIQNIFRWNKCVNCQINIGMEEGLFLFLLPILLPFPDELS